MHETTHALDPHTPYILVSRESVLLAVWMGVSSVTEIAESTGQRGKEWSHLSKSGFFTIHIDEHEYKHILALYIHINEKNRNSKHEQCWAVAVLKVAALLLHFSE